MLLKNFLLSKAKRELSPRLNHLSNKTGSVNRAIKKVIKEIDKIILDLENVTTKEYLETPRKYQALETVLSFLVHEGYSQVKQDTFSKKSGISKPLINEIIAWLEDIGVCQQIKTRYAGKKAPSVYILTLHSNYMDIINYFRNTWALAIEVTSTFSKLLQEKVLNKKQPELAKEEVPKKNTQGIQHFNLDTNSEIPKKLQEHASSDQIDLYVYAKNRFKNNEHVSEEDCYKIAIKMPKSMNKVEFDAFCETLECLNVQASSIDHIAAWVEEAYTLKYKDHLNKQKRHDQVKKKQDRFNLVGNLDFFKKTLGITYK
ncbi:MULTISPECIES: hypothetical protein [Bacillus]|uniref:hypothetical protein n=1 Tax=Bacillus TaxID=1386 RepID=UPI0006A8E286|nr:hypothetical protein [Bacillus sp. S0635]MCP1285224.1 hypothetical protein [Bacillus sp. S0635]CUB08718.1 hypothetical protein BN2127_JRS1_00502 [Bacillus cereus]